MEFEVQGLPEAVTMAWRPQTPILPTMEPIQRRFCPRPVTGAGTLTGDADGDDKSVTLTLGIPLLTMISRTL